jgi:hypothetical protein
MRRQRGLVGLTGLAALVGWGLVAQPAVAQVTRKTVVTTEQSASILVFPKVIADGTRDTIIQITNTSNNMQHAHCFYINGATTTPGLPPGPLNPPLCQEIDFDIWLTRQQPTHWVVSTGRLYNPTDKTCSSEISCCALADKSCSPFWTDVSGTADADCCDAGFDPGHVLPVAFDFTGELKCILVDASGAPYSGNSLKGEATLEDLKTHDVSKYNAIGIQGNDNQNGDDVLCLGSSTAPADPKLCPTGNEYAGCPVEWRLDHPATGAYDPVVQQQHFCTSSCACPETGRFHECICDCSSVSTNLTIVPCTENFESQALTPVTLQFLIINEFEQAFTTSTSFACWGSFDLGAPSGSLLPGISDWFTASALGSDTLQTRIRSAAGTPGGVLAVIEETHQDTVNGLTARSAQNGHMIGELNVMDLVTIPIGQGNDATPQ